MIARIFAPLTLALCAVSPAVAQESGAAGSLDELLQRIEQGRASDQQAFQEREARFSNAQANQQQLLEEAEQRREAAQRRSAELEARFEENEARIAEAGGALETRLGSLRELFGVLQQVAGDAQGLFESSLTSVQYPDRGEFLGELARKMGTSSKLASIEEIERLWFELQREMTEQGKVVRFPAELITEDGREVVQDVIRVGVFNIVSDGKYLQYTPETGNLSVMPRQPEQSRFTDTTSELFAATGDEGLVTFGIDPTRGQILGLLTEAPNFIERIKQGGLVGYVTMALGVLGLLIALERLVVLGIASRKVTSQFERDEASEDNPLGRVLKVGEQNRHVDTETLELKLGEAIMQETPALNRSILFIKVISVVAPLLGLLGTVTGMIVTFQAITLFGTGDPKLMAGGISQALVTTVQGLVVAIPMVLLHTLVSGRSRRIVHVLQEQAAGIVAERSERERAAARVPRRADKAA
ncbi:MAG: MotA/TolQ/ExbB proton channel family protein [Gammaproteobacteria bacterium]|nr:MotA/TolQ/ExbB proton channel family protein [Gammaproteobacteria bacterium]